MSFSLRVPSLDDAERIASLHVDTWQEAYADLLPADFFTEDHLEGRRKMWRGILSDPKEEWTIRIAEDPMGVAVGFAMSGPAFDSERGPLPRERQLYMIYVSAVSYGSGVGQQLLDAVLGEDPAILWVAKENPRAISFYARNGFTLDGVEQADPGAPRITDVRMVR